jgi:hypothetical protein
MVVVSFAAMPAQTSATPTVSPQTDADIVASLLQFDESCLSSCWWRFELGITTTTDWLEFFHTFSQEILPFEIEDDLIYTVAGRDIERHGDAFTIALLDSGGTVTTLYQLYPIFWEIEDHQPEENSYLFITDLLINYGYPDHVLITRISPGVGFLLHLHYFDSVTNIFQYYYLIDEVTNEEGIYYCPAQVYPYRIHIYTALNQEAFGSNLIATSSGYSTNRLQEVSEFDPVTFTDEILDNPEFCLIVPNEDWEWQGD